MKIEQIMDFWMKFRYLILSTGIVIMLGLIFSRFVGGPANVEVASAVEVEPTVPGRVYTFSLGTFENSEEMFAVEGALRILGLPVGMAVFEEGDALFTHLVADPLHGESVMAQLQEANLDFTVQIIEPEVATEKTWNYFYEAVNHRPFQIDEEFMDAFGEDEMEIWGYFLVLSSAGLEMMSSGRQQMLVEIFEWLINEAR